MTRQQYTLKGVDPEAIELMRTAARHEGMKIGAWVSARLKEAANRSLQLGDISVEIILPTDDRLQKIENELAEIARIQRTIMAAMLEKGTSK